MRNKGIVPRVGVVILMVVLFTFYIYRHSAEISAIHLSYPIYLAPMSLCASVMIVCNGLVTKLILTIFNIKLVFYDWFGLSVINSFGNLTTFFRGGLMSNAVYLKKKFNFSYTKFISVTAGTYILTFWLLSLLGLTALLGLPQRNGGNNNLLALFFIGLLCFFSLVILFAPVLNEKPDSKFIKVIMVINSWHNLSRHPKILVQIFVLLAVYIGITIINYDLGFRLIGQSYSYSQLSLLSIVSAFSSLVSITPGALGIRELFTGISGNYIGIPSEQIIVFNIIDRLINAGIVFLISLVVTPIMLKSITIHRLNHPKNVN